MQTSAEMVFTTVCQALRYSESSGFIQDENEAIGINQKLILQEAKEKLGIDAVYFIQTSPNTLPIPVVYFKKVKEIQLKELKDLHKRIWNQGRVPVLFIITPKEIRVYDCFSPPPETQLEDFDSGKRLIKKLESIIDEETIRQELSDYSREKLDTGGLWYKNDKRFNAENRADQHLLRNLRLLRRSLIEAGLDFRLVHSLIGRSIFILYLEDRGALQSFFSSFQNGRYNHFRAVLKDKEDTYTLFKLIGKHFNGDLFPVTQEEESKVKPNHLVNLKNFLAGADLRTGQTRLWPYSFDVIPIEFISSVYEEFFHSEQTEPKDKSATHYTPSFLVDFLLDQVLPANPSTNNRVLDPSCGSGIFLVAIYRRLIASKIAEQHERLSVDELKSLLQNNIFGTDINGEAIRVAAFSLYLTMLDYVEPKSLWQHQGLFPILIGKNLIQKNFITNFNPDLKFDVIIGNTPWGSTLNSQEMAYAERRGWAIGDKQVAQAFLWKALQIATADSIICLIVTSKGLLFNRNSGNRRFRRNFIQGANIQAIINFSALRYDIFENAIGPAAAVIYSKSGQKNQVSNIMYVVPKPSIETRRLGAVIIDYSDIKQIPRALATVNDKIWKSAMWGTPRDWNILSQLSSKPSLRLVARNRGWIKGQGFQLKGGNKKYAEWMANYPLFPHEYLGKFNIETNRLNYNHNLKIFHRPRSRYLYKAPLCLVKGSPLKGEIVAAFSDIDLCFNEQIIGIAGRQEDNYLLKILTCYLNSSLAQYFLFLTSSSWGVERDYILVDEYFDLPFITVNKDSEIACKLVQLHDRMAKLANSGNTGNDSWKEALADIDQAIFDLFELSEIDQEIVRDTVKYTIGFFQYTENSAASKPANDDILRCYAERFKGIMNKMLGDQNKSFIAKIYNGSSNMAVVSFALVFGKEATKIDVIKAGNELESVLIKLYALMKEQVSRKIHFKRLLKIYDSNSIYFVKPIENRYWTSIVSYNDADETVAELLESWSDERSA